MQKNFLYLLLMTMAFLPSFSFSHENLNFEYICAVIQKNKDGLFKTVVNVVFLPDWQKKSHIYRDEQKDIWFEIGPIKNTMGDIEGYQMELRLYQNGSAKPSFFFHGPEFSEIGFELDDLNIGANCFHRSQRGKNPKEGPSH